MAEFVQNQQQEASLLEGRIDLYKLSDKSYVFSLLGSIGLKEKEYKKMYEVWRDDGFPFDDGTDPSFGWHNIPLKTDFEQYFKENLERIRQLEWSEPGIVKLLFREFHICWFSRYSPETLLRQYRTRNDAVPYGVLIGAVPDYNDAFNTLQRRGVIESVSKQLAGHGYVLRIIEVDGLSELQRMLIKLNRRYAPSNSLRESSMSSKENEHRASFAIIAGHGTIDSVRLGTRPPYGYLTRESLLETILISGQSVHNVGVRRVKNFFIADPEIIFESCSTGVEKGIAQLTSVVFHGKTVGPNACSSISTISVLFDEANRPHFRVEYGKGVIGNEYSQGLKG